jgi:hypothetical protein
MKATTVISAIALLSSTLILPEVSRAEERICRTSLGAISVVNLRVPDGATCRLNGTRLSGNIVVGSRSTLIAMGIRVNGNIQAENSARVNVSSAPLIGGSVQIKQGGSAAIISNRINGSIQFESNSGALSARDNTVGADMQAFQNTGGVTIRGNRIGGNLQCKSNRPAPTGGGNVVRGNKEDQCARL